VHARPRAGAELRKMRLDGMTDRAIARVLLAAEGNQAIALDRRMREVTEAEIDAVLVRYLEALARECAGTPTKRFPESRPCCSASGRAPTCCWGSAPGISPAAPS